MLVPLPADEAVAQIVAAAPFLWMQSFAAVRQSLAGELLGPAGNRLWGAGPSASRARLLGGCRGGAQLAPPLAAPDAPTWRDGTPPPIARTAPAAAPSCDRARSLLVAALAAWDRGEPAAMDAPLEAARSVLFAGGDGEAGSGSHLQALWRWHHACGLRAMNLADGAAVIEHVGRALR